MNWQVLFSTFLTIFLAELGDKTQLSTMTMSAQSKSPVSVFLGAAFALVLSSFLGVLFGEAITKVIPPRVIQTVAGAAFIGLGALMVSGKI